MAKLVLTTFLTLDGVMQAPGGPDEDREDGFAHGGWLFPFADDEEFGALMDGVLGRAGAFLLGRRTYDIFAGYWPKVTDPADPIAAPLNTLPKYVASTTLREAAWYNTTVLTGAAPGGLVAEVAALKERLGDTEIQIHGSGALARVLMPHGVIDEYHLVTAPVRLGTGHRLFPEAGPPTAFRLTGTRTTPSGITAHTYRPTGPARFGTL
ncbi:dihydrofolate reductase family protein [Kitasatospora sp. NPDC004723]|uniref:dihydrofolate reductase family protein n=1 Tax=Kitasatospora sp. NPDC004723 TaxID=3154288 RepID=UPI0033A66924